MDGTKASAFIRTCTYYKPFLQYTSEHAAEYGV